MLISSWCAGCGEREAGWHTESASNATRGRGYHCTQRRSGMRGRDYHCIQRHAGIRGRDYLQRHPGIRGPQEIPNNAWAQYYQYSHIPKSTELMAVPNTSKFQRAVPAATAQELQRLRDEFFSPVASFSLNSSWIAGAPACRAVPAGHSKVLKPGHKTKRIPASQRAPRVVKGTNSVEKAKPDLDNCARLAFPDSAGVKSFIQSGS